MKGLEYILAIIGAIVVMKYLPSELGSVLILAVTIGMVFVFIILFKILLKIFRKIIKRIDDID